ncbi:MAG TPA: (E)-4-hydroxy-3-methylbut-2-enyl-diphosphate synthase [Candidatus Polarisedimenticolaceae bacterium]|nr:(E)-4-hydroxy-3-methylbut-2-enyl-diphosphate synthase [Candidatus Polarisedimenticolaceae bacterium]
MRLNPGLPAYQRRRTRAVAVGDVAIGGDHPIRVQSMTTPATTDTAATVAQIARLVDAGCEIVRVTVPTSADAENLPNIRRELTARGIRVPLVADIHFTPAAAMLAVEHVEKVRINPGNFADKKKFAVREYTDAQYDAELARIHAVFSPLVQRAKQLGVAMRIGTNHGSLSDRIMNRFGDSPLGMVESALEFVRICEDWGYRDLVLSMKASNPSVVLDAYRLLVQRMDALGMDYPLHLGVTEAGDGEDGRIKSALGIGVLLEEGIGDTVRVSLTEDPVAEVPVAFALVAPYNANLALSAGPPSGSWAMLRLGPNEPVKPYERASRPVRFGPRVVGGSETIPVEVPLAGELRNFEALRRELDGEAGVRVPEETRAEIVSVTLDAVEEIGAVAALRASMELVAPRAALSVRVGPPLRLALDEEGWTRLFDAAHRVHVTIPGPVGGESLGLLERLLAASVEGRAALLVEASSRRGSAREAIEIGVETARRGAQPRARAMLALDPALDLTPLLAHRKLASRLAAEGVTIPIVLLDRPATRGADEVLGPAAALGGLLCQGIGDAVHVDVGCAADARRLGFNILQAARVRMTKTEFISCPSCGRTLFDLESTTAMIKARTAHLKGLKIAVMGCVVNGPGEMADADFGYVGWGDEKIALFVGRDLVEKDIPARDAADRLVDLIKRHGKWQEL